MTDAELAELLTLTMTVGECGDTEYRNHLGQLHRIHGPAVILSNGSRYWYLDGNIHRTDGPAIEYSGSIKSWYLRGERFTEQEYNERIKSI